METIIDSSKGIPASAGIQNFTDEKAIVTESGFEWRERGGVRILVCSALERLGFANGFSTRMGGVSPFPDGDLNLAGFDEDAEENILENRRRFLRAFDREFTLATIWQVHGNMVKQAVTLEDAEQTEDRADAIVSDLPGILAGVKTADCVPILIADPQSMAFAAVHAGWRGTAASIAVRAINMMKNAFGANPHNLVCAIGPAAGGENYEVGHDVIEAFAANFLESEKYFRPTRPGHALVDLPRANKDQLIGAGLSSQNIFTAPFCTIRRTDLFFSYRVEKRLHGRVGRLLAVIGRK